jgi:predicted nucleotidyltransferase
MQPRLLPRPAWLPFNQRNDDLIDARIRELLSTAKAGLEHLYRERLENVYVFGSHARGEANSESDVDLLIVVDEVPDYGEEIRRTSELVSSLALQYDISISRVFVSRAHWERAASPFLINVRQDAVAA